MHGKPRYATPVHKEHTVTGGSEPTSRSKHLMIFPMFALLLFMPCTCGLLTVIFNDDASILSCVSAGSQLCLTAAATAAKGSSTVLQRHRCVRGRQHGIHGQAWVVGPRFGFSRL